jgi:hypothetical protein
VDLQFPFKIGKYYKFGFLHKGIIRNNLIPLCAEASRKIFVGSAAMDRRFSLTEMGGSLRGAEEFI